MVSFCGRSTREFGLGKLLVDEPEDAEDMYGEITQSAEAEHHVFIERFMKKKIATFRNKSQGKLFMLIDWLFLDFVPLWTSPISSDDTRVMDRGRPLFKMCVNCLVSEDLSKLEKKLSDNSLL
jgi:hypothetical protein